MKKHSSQQGVPGTYCSRKWPPAPESGLRIVSTAHLHKARPASMPFTCGNGLKKGAAQHWSLRRLSGPSYQQLCVNFQSMRLAPVGLHELVMGCQLRKLHLRKTTLYFSRIPFSDPREPRTEKMSRGRGGQRYGRYSWLSKATNSSSGSTVPPR